MAVDGVAEEDDDVEGEAFECCDCCHVRNGCLALGGVELAATAVLFVVSFARLHERPVDDATATRVGDLAALVLLALWILAVLCLFVAIATTLPELLIPHLILQAMTLLFSLVYFFLYAWEYFYEELYAAGAPFEWEAAVERLWLVSIFLLVALLELYAFWAVVSCARYLQHCRRARRRRQRHSLRSF